MSKRNNIEPVTENIVTVAEKVSALKQPEAYPHPVLKVETKETHMSWVFLVNDYVYKLKKPVQYHFLDFRALEARLKNCREEIRLNKSLANDIYSGLVPVTLNEDGQIQVEGKGQVIDWLVKMKRIPEENFLDYAILHQQVDKKYAENAANLLTVFYKNASPVPIDPALFRKKLKEEIVSTHAELIMPLYCLPLVFIEQISNNLVHFLRKHSELFDKRIADGKIIEAHGDLKPEHICLLIQPAIIDALEFNKELKIMDIAEELSFFDMECEMMGDYDTGQLFFDCYKKISLDVIPEQLIFFYKAKKAFLRTYLVARHITEAGYKNEPKWLNRANAYLQLAKKYNDKLDD